MKFCRSAIRSDVDLAIFRTVNVTLVTTCCCLFLSATAPTGLLIGAENPPLPAAELGFVELIDGNELAAWENPYKWGKVEVIDGEIHLTSNQKFFFVTKKQYADFIFEGDVKLPEGNANSGVMFRAHVEPNKVFGYQCEIDGDTKRGWTGGLYDEGRRGWFICPISSDPESIAAFRKNAGDAFKRNEWNHFRITCKGDHLRIEINGTVTTDVRDGMDASGSLGIQHHGEKGQTYRFRNLRVKELG